MEKCGDCGVEEGQYHLSGCDRERCRACNGQTISCGCTVEAINSAGGRYPFISFPLRCDRCLKPWPEFFSASDREWTHYLGPERRKLICLECYGAIQGLIDNLEPEFFRVGEGNGEP
jgi:hypothetical protein